MGMTDPIADMLTRVRNANRMKFRSVNARLSRMNLEIVKVLKRTGYISGFDVKRGRQQEGRPQDLPQVHGHEGPHHPGPPAGEQAGPEDLRVEQKIPKVINGSGWPSCRRPGGS
jgi:small subunit ribosomal protein S8